KQRRARAVGADDEEGGGLAGSTGLVGPIGLVTWTDLGWHVGESVRLARSRVVFLRAHEDGTRPCANPPRCGPDPPSARGLNPKQRPTQRVQARPASRATRVHASAFTASSAPRGASTGRYACTTNSATIAWGAPVMRTIRPSSTRN